MDMTTVYELPELPTAQDTPEEQRRKLDAMAEVYGRKTVFNFKRLITDNKNPVPGRFQEEQAAIMLREVMAGDPTLNFEEARRKLAKDLGYKDLARTNLYKLIDAGLPIINGQPLKKYRPKKNPDERRGRPRKHFITV